MKRAPYELVLKSRVSSARSKYRFHTADGVCSKNAFRKAELLLLETLWDVELGNLLCVEANYGVVGTVLADDTNSVRMTESSARAAQLCERNTRQNDIDIPITVTADLTALEDTFDTVAYAPKPYTPLPVGKQNIANALSVLRPGGAIYLTGSKQTGLTGYEDCLNEIAATVEQQSVGDGYYLLTATRPQSFDPPTYVSPRMIYPEINGVSLSLVTVPGLFSASGLDDGTRLLLETIAIEDGERVLDLCCGYGAIGTYAGQIADCEVWLSDEDEIATACAERSLRESHTNGTVITADCVEGVAGQTFDKVLCNPPTHAGDGVLSELFTEIDGVLASDGELTIVHHRELDLQAHLSKFNEIERCRTGEEHVVLNVSK
jgi:23S rRNA (guanine1835-N2)-methyltransferase